jgi:Cu+-exporting ATPase
MAVSFAVRVVNNVGAEPMRAHVTPPITVVRSAGARERYDRPLANRRHTMEQVFRIEGMHCGGCVARVTRALKAIADDVEVTLDPPQATLHLPSAVTAEAVQAAVATVGDYIVSAA